MDNLHTPMSTQEVADFFGISKDTLRYYEQKGIIPPIPRNKNGYRVYGNYELNLICLVLDLKKLGFPLRAISKFIYLFMNPSKESLNKQKQILHEQIQNIDKRIIELEEVRQLLEDKLETFDKQFAQYEDKERFKIESIWKNYQK